jgi:hypothetical protein
MAHLENVTFGIPDGGAIEGLRARIAAAGIPAREDVRGVEIADPSRNRLIFRSDAQAPEAGTP